MAIWRGVVLKAARVLQEGLMPVFRCDKYESHLAKVRLEMKMLYGLDHGLANAGIKVHKVLKFISSC